MTISCDGVSAELGGPETYLKFSELERKCDFNYKNYHGTIQDDNAMYYNYDYQTWYYNYYGEPHPFDQR